MIYGQAAVFATRESTLGADAQRRTEDGHPFTSVNVIQRAEAGYPQVDAGTAI